MKKESVGVADFSDAFTVKVFLDKRLRVCE